MKFDRNYFIKQAHYAINNKNFKLAKAYLKNAKEYKLENFEILNLLGVIEGLEGNNQAAIEYFIEAKKTKESDLINFNLGYAYEVGGQTKNALKHYLKAIELNQIHFESHFNAANCYTLLKNNQKAQLHYENALAIKPNYAEAWFNLGNIYLDQGANEKAIFAFEKAIELKPNYVDAYINNGTAYSSLKNNQKAQLHYENALAIKPHYAEAWFNLGNIYLDQGANEKAIFAFEKATDLKSDYANAFINSGVAYTLLNNSKKAILNFEKGIYLDQSIELGTYLHTKMKFANYDGYENILKKIENDLKQEIKIYEPFHLLPVINSQEIHLKYARYYAKTKYSQFRKDAISHKDHNLRIKIAYFSSDFNNHPVFNLLEDVFKLHDRSIYEIFAFSLGPINNGGSGKSPKVFFDRFFDVNFLSNDEILNLVRKEKIDIAINLNGYTKGSRTEIFASRVAPIQINFFGYLNTMGADFIDYIVADPIVIPQNSQKFYSEKIIYLPNSIMVDSRKTKSTNLKSADSYILPKSNFIFCCSNNGYKINPQIISVWSSILSQINESILWLSDNNESFKENLIKEFTERGIAANRIFFLNKLDNIDEYFSRLSLADLFLDTNPYSAHTTALDALRVGVPVITCPAETYVSRVPASLLATLGLDELIVKNLAEYSELAVVLAKSPKKLDKFKMHLIKNLRTTPLFNTALYVQHLESAFFEIYNNYLKGHVPKNIYV